MHQAFEEDCQFIADSLSADIKKFNGKIIFITGASGLIGQTLVRALLYIGQKRRIHIKIIAGIRDEEKAKRIFADCADSNLNFSIGDISHPLLSQGSVDYIIHAASETSSQAFVASPVETIATAIDGMRNILNFAKEKNAKSFVYLSTMEVYGAPETDEKIFETHSTNLNTMKTRSSYPESKRLCESLCAAYAAEYGVQAKVVRLTQTFGPGVQYDDGRVFAGFARSAIENRDIILHTQGETKRNYLYTADAATAILTVLLKGENGEAYNAANESTYCSIREMAELVASKIAGGQIKVIVEESDTTKFGYAPTLKMNLSTQKLQKLGWRAKYSLEEMFNRMIPEMPKSSAV